MNTFGKKRASLYDYYVGGNGRYYCQLAGEATPRPWSFNPTPRLKKLIDEAPEKTLNAVLEDGSEPTNQQCLEYYGH